MKAKAKRKMLRQKRQGFSAIELKFSLFIKSNAAAASRPTTAGRKPLKTFSTDEWLRYFIRNLLISNIKMKLGSTTAKVARKLPRIPQYGA